MNYNLAILKNETENGHLEWVAACENSPVTDGFYKSVTDEFHKGIRCRVIDITRNDWMEEIMKEDFDMFLTRPPDRSSLFKQLYDERLYIIHNVLKKRIYPSYEEILVYENKKFLSYWLKANRIPHPDTRVFYHKDEALEFIQDCSLPQVGKTAVGAAGSGVRIMKSREELKAYVDQAFSEKGLSRRWGPNTRKGNYGKRLLQRLKDIPGTVRYFRDKKNAAQMDPHRWFVILQAYIPADFEWRAVRIGDSFFAHKKLARMGNMFSGTSKVSWDAPPEKLLDFVKMVTDTRNFLSLAVDIFEDKEGNYYVNELQCFFGSQNPHQMIIDGKPGRYIHNDGRWEFQEGVFNSNNSYDLRLRHVLELMEKK
ncbi:MAG: hypothetical protein GY950_14945 [bacterium]|nr:hypothetical protein [bacterium]